MTIKYFKPIVDMTPGIDSSSDWTVLCAVLTPNGCYIAKPKAVVHAWPKGMVGIPEYEPLQLILDHTGGPCTQEITSIKYDSTSVSPNGKQKVVVFCILNDEIVGITNAPFARGVYTCLLYTSPSPRDKRQSRMPSSA